MTFTYKVLACGTKERLFNLLMFSKNQTKVNQIISVPNIYLSKLKVSRLKI